MISLSFWKHHMLLNLNVFINPSFYYVLFLNNILDAVLCSAETKMNLHSHSSFEIRSCRHFSSLWANTCTSKLSKSRQLGIKTTPISKNLFSIIFAVSSHVNANQLVSDGQKYIYSINHGDISSQQRGAGVVRHRRALSQRSLSQPQEKGFR